MCDTLVLFKNGKKRSFFAKNSDRDPDEFQFIYITNNPQQEFKQRPFEEKKTKYIENSFVKLKNIFYKFDNKYRAILSRPNWIWGAEMGVNEYGLSIGNEAVFSKEKVAQDGLLGMDILRLALHNTRSARKAVEFIINVTEKYSQGGDGGYSSSLYYHNSYLIKDFTRAYILETAADKWAVKKVDKAAAISNTYTITDDYDHISDNCGQTDSDCVNFKAKYEDKIYTYVSKGNYRYKYSSDYLNKANYNLNSLLTLLRSHKKGVQEIKRGMSSICMHPGSFVKSKTTASMVVDYINDNCIIWFTGSPNPCLSLYKPVIITEGQKSDFGSIDYAVKFCSNWRDLSTLLEKKQYLFKNKIKPLRDKVEEDMVNKVYKKMNNNKNKDLISVCQECRKIAEDFRAGVIEKLK
ncbi:MAG: carcinine hydrolase/isopenicillin-N N-acyltransferase family protein [Halothermotrichaceae bacterium]